VSSEVKWSFACSLADLETGPREVLIGESVLAIFKTANGVFAIDGMCAHQGGPLAQGALDGHCLTCPWHGWQYNVTNGENLLTGRKMLGTYETELRNDQVWVRL
jgi:nitrite reductase (NADH) small subunit